MKKFKVTLSYEMEVVASNEDAARVVAVHALEDALGQTLPMHSDLHDLKQLEQVFVWNCQEIQVDSSPKSRSRRDQALAFMQEYITLCQKWGCMVEADSYEEPIIIASENIPDIAGHIQKIRVV